MQLIGYLLQQQYQFNLDITGVSTSSAVYLFCGGASDQYSTPTYELFNLTLATSTLGVL